MTLRRPYGRTSIETSAAGALRGYSKGMGGHIRIGTSGWSYAHWRNVFYPPSMPPDLYLSTYAGEFCTVEINSSFYHLPGEKAVRTWVSATPSDFVFSLKGSSYITHRKKLNDPERTLTRFTCLFPAFGEKLGPVLFQLPPRFHVNLERLERFLAALPPERLYAFEFRDPSWFVEPVRRLLTERGAALCMYDMAGLVTPDWVTAPFVYLRLHGPSPFYLGRYTDGELEGYAGRIDAWASEGRDVYCYFNNDALGNAIFGARALRQMLGGHC
jgi:uncharacterized protein YecE (DUF72 family)